MSTKTVIPIFDGHNDTILDLFGYGQESDRSFFVRSDQGHIDLPRAREGGLGGGFFALFTPSPKKADGVSSSIKDTRSRDNKIKQTLSTPLAEPVELSYAQEFTFRLAAQLFRLEAEAQGQIKIVRTVDQLSSCLEEGVLAIIFHIEGAEAIDTSLDTLQVLYQAGLRSLGVVWSRPNAFGHGVPFKFPASPDIGPGLTDAGRNLVKMCNQLGILVDLSHLNEQGFWDVANLSNAPLVATHSGAHKLCHSPRNLTDKQLDAVKESDGIVGVNYHIGFLREDGQISVETSLTEIVRHVSYMVERMGIEHVALGSDFDGATMPQDLGDVAGLPKLVAALRSEGYDDAALRKIGYENWLRVLGQSWK